jgi:fatty acid desaturase
MSRANFETEAEARSAEVQMTTNRYSDTTLSTAQAEEYTTLSDSLTPGLLILTVGIVLLISQLGWLSPEELWNLWPIGLIMAGISELEEWWRHQ